MSEIREIIGNTTATPMAVPDWSQTDETKADYIKNKPTNVSDFQNDVGYLTEHQSLAGLASEDYVEEQIAKIPTPDVSGQINTHDNNSTAHNDIRAAIPTNVSQLTNDSGFITTVPDEIYVGDGEMPEDATIQIIMDGSDEEEKLKDELKEYIDTELVTELAKRGQLKPEFANDVSECTDTTKLYVLPDGYIYGYVKTVTEGETIPNFTNLMDDPNAYIKNGYRYSNSSAAFKECETDCAIIVPITKQSTYTFRTRGGSYNSCLYPNSVYVSNANDSFSNSISLDGTKISWGTETNGDTYITIPNPVTTTYKYAVFHVAAGVNRDTLIVTLNEEITYTVTEGRTEYQWVNTGHAFVPADYEDRIIDVETNLDEVKKDIKTLQENLEGVSITKNATTVFSTPAYAPVPQLPADGSEGSDFNYETVTTQFAYDYMDALCNQYKYKGYITKQTMGKDASGEFDHNRYILTKAYWRAWQKENYPKMFAWKNGSTVIYSVSVSPRVGDNMYSTPYVGTVYQTVTSVNCTTGVLSTRTVNSLVFTRYTEGDIEPTIVYTRSPMAPPGYFATAPVYDAAYSEFTKVSSFGDGYIICDNGTKYMRYPFEDRRENKTKPLSIFILANEHGLYGDALIPSFVVMRMAKDLCKNTENPFLKWLKENTIITMIPVGNPWGYARYLNTNQSERNGYCNANGVNINRNYDTPGWATSDTNYGDVETFGVYAGSEIETQHIMNTMLLCKPSVGISMHGLGYPEEYRGLIDNGYFCYQGQGFDKDRMYKVAETLFSSYGLSRSVDTEYASHYEMCGKSPAYIQYVGAVGGLTETICWEVGTENEYTSMAMEQAYSQLLIILQNWCEEAIEKISNAVTDHEISY